MHIDFDVDCGECLFSMGLFTYHEKNIYRPFINSSSNRSTLINFYFHHIFLCVEIFPLLLILSLYIYSLSLSLSLSLSHTHTHKRSHSLSLFLFADCSAPLHCHYSQVQSAKVLSRVKSSFSLSLASSTDFLDFLSRHLSLSSITSDRSSRQNSVYVQSCCSFSSNTCTPS